MRQKYDNFHAHTNNPSHLSVTSFVLSMVQVQIKLAMFIIIRFKFFIGIIELIKSV